MKELEKILGRELASLLADKLGNDKIVLNNGTLIPKHRFDCVNISLKEHKEKVILLKNEIKFLNAKLAIHEIQGENTALKNLALELLTAKTQNPQF